MQAEYLAGLRTGQIGSRHGNRQSAHVAIAGRPGKRTRRRIETQPGRQRAAVGKRRRVGQAIPGIDIAEGIRRKCGAECQVFYRNHIDQRARDHGGIIDGIDLNRNGRGSIAAVTIGNRVIERCGAMEIGIRGEMDRSVLTHRHRTMHAVANGHHDKRIGSRVNIAVITDECGLCDCNRRILVNHDCIVLRHRRIVHILHNQ